MTRRHLLKAVAAAAVLPWTAIKALAERAPATWKHWTFRYGHQNKPNRDMAKALEEHLWSPPVKSPGYGIDYWLKPYKDLEDLCGGNLDMLKGCPPEKEELT